MPAPDLSTPARRGAYLATIGACSECHTPLDDRGQPILGLEFAGGFVFDGPWAGWPAPTSRRIQAAFRITTWRCSPRSAAHWDTPRLDGSTRSCRGTRFGGMTDEDIAAVFANLTTLKPVMHRVTNDEGVHADVLQALPSSARLRRSKLTPLSEVSTIDSTEEM